MTFDEIKELSVDLIIPVYHPDEKFYNLLKKMEIQTKKPNKIIILQTVEDKNNVEDLNIPEDMGIDIRIEYIDKINFDHGGTRRYGASLSQADILMCMTQDAVPTDEFLIERLLEPYTDTNISASYARQLPDSKADIIEAFTRKFNYPDKDLVKSAGDINVLGIKTYFCSNVCATYRRDVYDKLGGFVNKTIFNEDMILAHDMIHAGYKIAYVSKAQVTHSHLYSYLQQFSRNFDLGVSHRQYEKVFLLLRSESEGIRLVKDTLQYLIDQKKFLLIPDLILSSGFKYLGYKFGLNYRKLPADFVVHCSMNKNYWK
ncbi:MAG: glycosyltransferase family 2 protein [Clostridiales bacterium]|nr:glycosyltransferase family 2 protein [Clostridiales bacterium]